MDNQQNRVIFLKEDSYQEKILEMPVQYSKLKKEELDMLQKGVSGERQIKYQLKKSNMSMYAIHDIYMTCDGQTAQIDFALITSHHCYFVECKNYEADMINVDEMGNFTLSTRYGKRYNRKGIASPLSQVDNQLNVFEKICYNNQDEIRILLSGNRFKNYFKTMVVFTNPSNIINAKKAPNDFKYRILKVDNLMRQIEYDDKHFTGKRLTPMEMYKMAEFILHWNIERKEVEIDKPVILPEKKSDKALGPDNKEAIIGFIIGFLLILLSLIISGKTNLILKKNEQLTSEQKIALRTLKSRYEGSKRDGFEIMNTSICREISKMFNNEFSCNRDPLYVNYLEESNTYTIYRNFICYKLTIDNNKISNTEKKYIGYDTEKKCTGYPVGVLEWNNENEYYQKIGGYNKIREIAIYSYNNNALIHDYYDSSHIQERGGNPTEWPLYQMNVDSFFAGLTGRGYSIKMDTTQDKFDEIMKEFYYIMK